MLLKNIFIHNWFCSVLIVTVIMAGLPNNLARYCYQSSAPTPEEKTDTKRGDRTSSSYPILNHDFSSNFSDSKDLSFLSMSLQNRLYGLPNSPEALLSLVEISSLGCQCILGGSHFHLNSRL